MDVDTSGLKRQDLTSRSKRDFALSSTQKSCSTKSFEKERKIQEMSDVPLGFGIAAQPTEYCKDLDPGSNVVLHQGDIGEYLRIEDGLF